MAAATLSLAERLGGRRDGRSVSERAGMARTGFYLLAVGGLLALVSLALPTDEARNGTAIFVTATIALALSLVPLVGFDRLPVVAFELLASAGTLLVSSALWYGGTDGYELFYFWVALYAAYFLPLRKVVGQLAVIVSCYGLVELAAPGPGVTPVHWLVAAGTLSVAAGLVLLLKANLVGSIERLEALIEASPLASIELDGEGRVRGWNRAAESLLGWSFDEVVGRPLPVETGDALLADLVRSGPSRADHELTCVRRTGAVFDASLYTAPVGNGDGLVGGHIVLLADTTARKEHSTGGSRTRARWSRSAGWPAGSRTTSTTCCSSCAATPACCASAWARSSRTSSTRSSVPRTTPDASCASCSPSAATGTSSRRPSTWMSSSRTWSRCSGR